VHADEHDLESAHEIASQQQQERPVGERFADRFQDALFMARDRRCSRLAQPERHRNHQQHDQSGQQVKRVLPAGKRDQFLFDRHHHELAERTRRGR